MSFRSASISGRKFAGWTCTTSPTTKPLRRSTGPGSTQKGDRKGTEAFGECIHPVFRTNEDTNRKAVYVNRLMTVGIVDMPKEESDPLLKAVFDHAERKEFVYEHVWRVGELLLWDNRCSSHARTDFPSTQRRLMWRTTF